MKKCPKCKIEATNNCTKCCFCKVPLVSEEFFYFAVIWSIGKWAVRRHGASRALKRFDLKREAIKEGKRLARGSGGRVYLHKKDGTVEWVNDYSGNKEVRR